MDSAKGGHHYRGKGRLASIRPNSGGVVIPGKLQDMGIHKLLSQYMGLVSFLPKIDYFNGEPFKLTLAGALAISHHAY